MKKCPLCKMIVDAEYECPICYTTITYEPDVESDREKYVCNKYFILYLIRKGWFSILCLIFVVFRIFSVQTHSIPCCILSLFCVILCLVESIFDRHLAKYIQWKYSEEYSEYKALEARIVSGIIAVLSAIAIPYF